LSSLPPTPTIIIAKATRIIAGATRHNKNKGQGYYNDRGNWYDDAAEDNTNEVVQLCGAVIAKI
jgi:hypothetical protein